MKLGLSTERQETQEPTECKAGFLSSRWAEPRVIDGNRIMGEASPALLGSGYLWLVTQAVAVDMLTWIQAWFRAEVSNCFRVHREVGSIARQPSRKGTKPLSC